MDREITQKAITLLMSHADEDLVSKKDAIEAATNLHNAMVASSDNQEAVDMIITEVNRAELKHPNWPEDTIYGMAIVSEESGEAMRAAVQYEMEGGDLEEVRKELVHTAATCIRMLKNLPEKFIA